MFKNLILWFKWFFIPDGVIMVSAKNEDAFAIERHVQYRERLQKGKRKNKVCPICNGRYVTVKDDATCGNWKCYRKQNGGK
jgi:hypothetical protein